MTLQRLVLNFTREGVEVCTLYRRRSQDCPNPGTAARRREVWELTRTGLGRALQAPGGHVDVTGTSGFTQREDILSLPAASPWSNASTAREAAW
jgi:hypothetical protein